MVSAADASLATTTELSSAAVVEGVSEGRRRKRRRGRPEVLLWMAVTWLVVLILLAALADWLPFIDDYDQLGGTPRTGPSAENWFGTDRLGRDVFSRSVYGARMSLMLAGCAVIFGLGIGGALGLIAGYVRGTTDGIISTLVDVMLSLPALILALAITSFLGNGATQVILALTLLSIAPTVRLVRAQTMQWATREFVTAARTSGSTRRQVLMHEIVPNVVPAAVSFTILGVAILVIAEGALAFLGQSVAVPVPTWGFMIAEGAPNLEDAWWMSLLPAAAMFLTIAALNVLGDRVARRYSVGDG